MVMAQSFVEERRASSFALLFLLALPEQQPDPELGSALGHTLLTSGWWRDRASTEGFGCRFRVGPHSEGTEIHSFLSPGPVPGSF